MSSPLELRPSPADAGLEALERQVLAEREMLAYPSASWVMKVDGPDGGPVLDCAIIGAGQYGLTIASGLRRERVDRIALFDHAEQGHEGPWLSFARMAMLRTPKELTGPDLGLPSLSFRAWWEAQHGAQGWERLFRIPRTAWMEYLDWYRRTLDLPVRNRWSLRALTPTGDGAMLRLEFATPGGARLVHARTCVLATGAAGSGGFSVPPHIASAVPAERVRHANQPFDIAIMQGQRLGVLGAGASAFDVAADALRAGAVSAALCFRRPSLPTSNPRRWMENAGFLSNYVDLPDRRKWATMLHLQRIGQGPPKPTYDAAAALPGFSLHALTPWERLHWNGREILVEGGGQRFVFDQLVVATGLRVDFSDRPELAAIADAAAFWSDRYVPEPGEENAALARFPYLDRLGAFLPREPGAAAWLSRILTITRGATLSLGPVAASNSGMKYVAPRLIEGVKRRLLLDQLDHDWALLTTRDHAELTQAC